MRRSGSFLFPGMLIFKFCFFRLYVSLDNLYQYHCDTKNEHLFRTSSVEIYHVVKLSAANANCNLQQAFFSTSNHDDDDDTANDQCFVSAVDITTTLYAMASIGHGRFLFDNATPHCRSSWGTPSSISSSHDA